MLNELDFKNKKWIVVISATLFIIYILIAVTLLFLSPYRQAAQELNSSGQNPYNLVPFKTIKDYLKASQHIDRTIWISNLFGNILAFLPLGFFLPLLFRKWGTFWKTTIFVIFATFTVEIIQYVTKVGSFDIDDILLNTFGGMIGYLGFFIFYHHVFKKRSRRL